MTQSRRCAARDSGVSKINRRAWPMQPCAVYPTTREVEVYFNIRQTDQRHLELRSTVEADLRECSHDARRLWSVWPHDCL